jgi:MoaA/NifB/PqqE/SkfB family radical SAM enzyme
VLERLDLKVGFGCNNNCLFCAQAHRRSLGDQTTEKLKNDLKNAYEEGIREVVFTGGEPTIRKDIFELVKYAKNLGYELIQIQTNGRMLSYKSFCKKIIEAGATEFSPALHGHTPEIHDAQTRSAGSFRQTLQAIKNLKEFDQYVLSNSVITKFNYRTLPELAQLLIDLGVDQFQLAFVHPVGNAMKYFDLVVPKKSLTAPYIHKALDLARTYNVRAMVEAFPFCFMKGYEKHCSEFYIPSAEVRDAEGVVDFEVWRRSTGKAKFPQCKECKYDLICEGPWKEYPERYGDSEFVPVEGKKIKKEEELVVDVRANHNRPDSCT